MKSGKTIFLKFGFCALAAFGAQNSATAQTEINVQRDIEIMGRAKPVWVSMSGFTGEAADVIRFDLYVQGFNFTNADGAQYLISGNSGENLQGRVTDRFNKNTLVSRSYTSASLRRQAHAFVDEFVAAVPNHGKGIGQTKIAFKVEQGGSSEIYIADFDGHNAQAVTSDNSIVAAPAWVPGKLALYYTSYKLGNPDIFHHDLSTGEWRAVARHSGLNTSAAPSPDGSKMAMILDKAGTVNVYVSSADGTGLKRLTTSEEDSSPCWSPDGQWICFATKINGRRMLAKVPASGGPMERVATSGVSNPTEPDWSPDGKWIAFTRQGGDFDICVVPAGGGIATLLVAGEDPSWAPNGRTLIFARRVGYRYVLSLLDVPTKQYKDVSRISGITSSSQPSWAK